MKMLTDKLREKIEENTLRLEVTPRGGGIEIDLTNFGFKGEKMTAYQNYLGGGMLGRVCTDCTLYHKDKNYKINKLKEVEEMLKGYYFELTNPESEDEICWESQTFEQNQTEMPESAY